MKEINIRSYSWGAANISWSVVIEELLFAAEQKGHNTVFLSTNGFKGMKHWTPEKSLEAEFRARELLRDGGRFDIDLTYTVPQNFPQRFLGSSKCKMAIYAYESSIMPNGWKDFYGIVDYVLPPSKYCADMIRKNGCPDHKIKVVPHGVDTDVFHPDVSPLDLKLDHSVKFLCVAEPHYRKQIDRLMEVFCKTFTSDDDVCLVIKTKIFRTQEDIDDMKGFEMDLMPIVKRLKNKYGAKMPRIQFVSKRLRNISSLYAACDAFTLMTASEGWGVPYLEALAMGMPVIAPRHGGQLEFLNDDNAVLTPCGTRKARPQEQYWGGHPNATVGNPNEKAFGEAMHKMYEEIRAIKTNKLKLRSVGFSSLLHNRYEKMRENALATAQRFTWKNAMQRIIDIAEEHNDRL